MSAVRPEIATVLNKAASTHTLSKDEIVALLGTEDEETRSALFRAADETRARYLGDAVHLRAIIEFSSHCVRNCLYCGLRRDNRRLDRFRMRPGEIFEAARRARAEGYRTIVLQSGEDPHYEVDALAGLIRRLKSELDVAVTLSLGDMTRETYRLLRAAGADRYLLKHETADPALFARLRPGTMLSERLKRLVWLREAGYQVGGGNLVGLPGQSLGSLAADLLVLKRYQVHMAGIGPFIPNPDTPLAGSPPGSPALTLKVLAVTRLLLPRVHLPATTAVSVLHPEGRQLALRCGANVVMPDLTPDPYCRHYDIYPGKARLGSEGPNSFAWWEKELARLGRQVGKGRGHGWEAGR
ncbi:MAG: [FeFe] hydrogenase H-cluster radical SAM maturase HydE [Candidatus Desulforudis sp.]|nr:[FeFe] hydrogenase H-cluster radical SAM maturase HydE [Desulforudis sp.]